ncbi:MAG: hypothetical protein KGZ60_10930 [Truepera sp.]|nr:hypothetical protein [Truepera sp.]
MKRLSLLLAVLSLSWALATTFTALTLEELTQKADLAVFGVVENVAVEARDGEPWTVVTLTVTRPLAGELGDTLSLAFYGGVLETGLSISVVGMPSLAIGDEVLLLAYDAPYYSPIVGFNQGLWRLTELGFVDAQERLLSLDEAGALLLDGEGGDTEAILTALEPLLENR